jgi:hypothetical protein
MKPRTWFVFAVAMTAASAARAEGPTAGAAPPPIAKLDVGFGITELRQDDTHVRQSRLTIAPEFSLGHDVSITPLVRLTTTSIDLLQKDSMPFDASLSFPWQPSLGARLSYGIVHYKWFRLELNGEFEVPLGQNRAWLSSFTPRGAISQLDVNVDTLRNHVTVDHDWRTFMATTRVQGDFGRFHPYVDMGFLMMSGRLAVNFDSTAISLLQTANFSPDRFYDSGSSSPYYMLGLKVDLGKGFALRASGMVLPWTDDKMFYSAEGAVVIPLDFIHF